MSVHRNGHGAGDGGAPRRGEHGARAKDEGAGRQWKVVPGHGVAVRGVGRVGDSRPAVVVLDMVDSRARGQRNGRCEVDILAVRRVQRVGLTDSKELRSTRVQNSAFSDDWRHLPPRRFAERQLTLETSSYPTPT